MCSSKFPSSKSHKPRTSQGVCGSLWQLIHCGTHVLYFQEPVLGEYSGSEGQESRYLVPSVSRVELVLASEGVDYWQTTDAALQTDAETPHIVTVDSLELEVGGI